jgi:uncharacterized protein YacL
MIKWIEKYFFKKFQKQMERKYVFEVSSFIDGRIISMFTYDGFDGGIVVPNFVVVYLKQMTTSDNIVKSGKGNRGLGILEKFRKSLWQQGRELSFIDCDFNGTIDEKIIHFCEKYENAIIVTMSSDIMKIAKARKIKVLNLHTLINDLQEQIFVNDKYVIRLTGRGKEEGQCIGYLDNMLVFVNHSEKYFGKTVPVIIKNVLKTDRGRIAFADLQWDEIEGDKR